MNTKKSLKKRTIKDLIIMYATVITIILGIWLLLIMIITGFASTRTVLFDTLQIIAKTSSQNISSNLHLLTDRMDSLAQESILSNPNANINSKRLILDNLKERIEFVWIAAYDTSGNRMYEEEISPASISDEEYYTYLQNTENITISNPYYANDTWQICVGIPISYKEEINTYIVGSYKYDILNDVLSNINIGSYGQAFIVDKNGIILADKDMSNPNIGLSLYDLYSSNSNNKVFDQLNNFNTGIDNVFLHGTQNYLAYSPIAGTNWTLVIAAPGADFLKILFISIIISLILVTLLVFSCRKAMVHLASGISLSLNTVAERLSSLSAGNLSDEVILSDNNVETEQLTSALSVTVTSLAGYIYDIQTYLGLLSSGDYSQEVMDSFTGDFVAIKDALAAITESLNATIHKISNTSLALTGNAAETSDYAKKLYNGSLEQTSALERLRGSVHTITETITAIDSNANQVKSHAVAAESRVNDGIQQMNNMLSTMNSINENMKEIITISQLIEEISSETSLLALNATIEAARAGESGRGFAVVAQQIGQLADQTAGALNKTSEIIAQANKSIQYGLTTANATAESFQNIREATAEFTEISDNMLQTTIEQKHSVDLVVDEVSTVLRIANDNLQLAKGTDETATMSSTRAEELAQIVSSVKLKEV